MPNEICDTCGGTGKIYWIERTGQSKLPSEFELMFENMNRIYVSLEDYPWANEKICYSCNGNRTVRPYFSDPIKIQNNVINFSKFCRESGGFSIY